ncbi:efflux RND transporter permease subunit, partial [Methylobacterium oxalidis]|uniref:efflux RND transporter permease subunit n=1 Tax=Methylobacterium oxalidis TaxID=944322 RepID=UPI003314832E
SRSASDIPARTKREREAEAPLLRSVSGFATRPAYLILKPQASWPDPTETKESLIGRMEAEAKLIPGTLLGFSQPIQMRFNELIAGVRDDLAVNHPGIFGGSNS